MRRVASLLALVGLVVLLDAPEARGGSAGGEEEGLGLVRTGPAITATVVLDPTAGSPTKGKTTIRLAKGTAHAAAIFHNKRDLASLMKWGCDGINGTEVSAPASLQNVTSLTNFRFDDKTLRSWIPENIVTALLFNSIADGGLGLDPTLLTRPKAGITDIDNALCTKIADDDFAGFKYILSFDALIQFAD